MSVRMIETFEFAPKWLKKAVGEKFTVAIVLRQFENAPADGVLRDRTADAHRMLVGFDGTECIALEKNFKGYELFDAGWDISGAQLAQDFKIVYKR